MTNGPPTRHGGGALHEAPTRIAFDVVSAPHAEAARLDSIDLLRGLVMVIMALDHVRDYFTDVRFYPLDLSKTTVALALTRWVTHFCAPVFVFLAGTGAFLSLRRGKTRKQLSSFLVTRGLWLVVLELTVVRFGWMFNVDYTFALAQVIWAIGWSMVVLSLLILVLPSRAVGAFGAVMILSHNLLDGVNPGSLGGGAGWLWQILHAGGPIEYAPGYVLLAAYPLIPWIGVMAAGYGFAEVFTDSPDRRRSRLLRWGIGLTAAFVIVRWVNAYGDPHPWSADARPAFLILSFLNCEKYPPSLLYLLMTLGPAIALLPLLEKWKGRIAQFFVTFGRVPLFYYVLHIPIAHALAIGAAALSGHDAGMMFSNVPPWEWPPGYGFSLPVVYAVWAGLILALYPACRWFADLKRRRKEPWLSYL